MNVIPVRRSTFLTADYITIPQIEEVAKGVKRVIEETGSGSVTLILEAGKIVAVQIMTSHPLGAR